MQFNSYIFILIFVPATVAGYFMLNRISYLIGKIFLVVVCAFFYVYGGVETSLVLFSSIAFNVAVSCMLVRKRGSSSFDRWLFRIGIWGNIAVLFFFKYLNWGIGIINARFERQVDMISLVMPIGISFFTFQQIMYISSVYKKEIEKIDILDYLSYILFFPKVIMGPLTAPKDFISQLNDTSKKVLNWDNIASGLKLFSFGLLKKMVIADTFAKAVNWGFENANDITCGETWLIMFFYTFEIYFDFSGYSDMAIGVSEMLNIDLPINFDSPYKATSIRDFWKRWHISLTSFLTKYVYYPLGGNKKGKFRTYANILAVFLISGLWHGANWTFVLWGGLHGLFQILERIFDKAYNKLFVVVKWVYTFTVVNFLWLLFRSDSILQWKQLVKKMLSLSDMNASQTLLKFFELPEKSLIFDILRLNTADTLVHGLSMVIFLILSCGICLIPENNYRNRKKINVINLVAASVAFIWGFVCLGTESIFVYYNF